MTRKARRTEETFADFVSRLPEEAGSDQPVPVVNLAQLAEFTDAAGTRWRKRGETLEGKALQRLLLDEHVRVLHDYMGDVTEVLPTDRQPFWSAAQDSMAASPYSHFYGAEFKNERRQHLLVVHEDC